MLNNEKLALSREYGANEVINYSKEDLKNRVKEMTAGKGADVVLQPRWRQLFGSSQGNRLEKGLSGDWFCQRRHSANPAKFDLAKVKGKVMIEMGNVYL